MSRGYTALTSSSGSVRTFEVPVAGRPAALNCRRHLSALPWRGHGPSRPGVHPWLSRGHRPVGTPGHPHRTGRTSPRPGTRRTGKPSLRGGRISKLRTAGPRHSRSRSRPPTGSSSRPRRAGPRRSPGAHASGRMPLLRRLPQQAAPADWHGQPSHADWPGHQESAGPAAQRTWQAQPAAPRTGRDSRPRRTGQGSRPRGSGRARLRPPSRAGTRPRGIRPGGTPPSLAGPGRLRRWPTRRPRTRTPRLRRRPRPDGLTRRRRRPGRWTWPTATGSRGRRSRARPRPRSARAGATCRYGGPATSRTRTPTSCRRGRGCRSCRSARPGRAGRSTRSAAAERPTEPSPYRNPPGPVG
jgi:hypothetical protein